MKWLLLPIFVVGCSSDRLLKCELTLEVCRKNSELCEAEKMRELALPCTCENLTNP